MKKLMRNKKHILGIVGALLLVLFITPFLPGTATATKDVENTYALVVTTGNDAGDQVSYFGLQYIDTDGYTHIEHVFPYKGDLQKALAMASGGGDYSSLTPLGRGKTDTYFFEPTYEVAKIVGLDIYCQGAQGTLNAWDVSGLRLYRVDQLIDVVTNGGSAVIRFNGSQIAYMQERSGNGGETFSWTGNTLFQLRDEAAASYKLVFETLPYSMDSNYEYVVRMDIADKSGAGFELMNQPYNQKNSLRDANFGEYMAIQIEYLDIFGDSRTVTQPVMTNVVSWMMNNGVSGDTQIAGIAQQGETIVFGCTLQDLQELRGIMLYTGSEASALLSQPVAGSESATFTGISLYDASAVSASPSAVENSANGPEYYFASNPLYYYTASSIDGETVSADSTHYVSMRPYEVGALLTPTENKERYMVELRADPSTIMQPPTDLLVELRYVDMAGVARTSGQYSVRNGAIDYYGYWPASSDDFAYTGQVTSDGGIRFIMELSQVEHFTGLTISVPIGSSDWQMAGFKVDRVESLGERVCVWEDVVSPLAAVSNRRYYRTTEGYTIFSMEEKALIQPDSDCTIDFTSQSVQRVDDLDWSDFYYSMSYDQCTSNLGLAKIRENYTVEVQVQSGTTSLLDGYGDNGSKNRFYFLLEFENGDSGYVLANQQLSADGFRSGCTESFVISTNYDYGNLVAVHVIPDDISEDSDPYDKLNIAQIRVRRNDNGSISKEWIIQNVGWIGIDYQDEGANSSIAGQQGRAEVDIARIYPVSYSSYALNLEFRIGTGVYSDSGSGGPFYGTIEGTLEYYNQDGKRNQLTFDVVRAMYEYANKTPIYLNDGTTGSAGSPLAITDNSFMFRENHTDRFVISVSDVARLGKLSLNMKSRDGGSLQITNVTAALVMEQGYLEITEQDEYVRIGDTEYLCEDTVDKIPAFELFLPTDRNIYQDIYFTDHEPIKLDVENSTWISAVSRVPNSQNDTINVYVYPAEDSAGNYAVDVRAQFTDINGTILETGAKNLTKTTDADGKTVYVANGLTATGMSDLNRVYVKAQSADVVDAYMDHVVVQQVRTGVVINTFYLDCEHKNAEMEFYTRPSSSLNDGASEQKVYLTFGDETEVSNLVSENRDVAVALRYTTTNGGNQVFTSRYVYITDEQYNSIKAGDIVSVTFNENYVREITGIMVASSGNVKAQIDMACADNYSVDSAAETKRLLKHFSFPTGATVQNTVATLEASNNVPVEILEVQFVTALADAYLESGTTDPIVMVVGYTDNQGVPRETVVTNIRDYVISEGDAFATGSTTQIRVLLRNVASVQYLKLMPYDLNPQTKAGWKPSQIVVSLGTDGSVQKVNRAVDSYIYESGQLNPEGVITGSMVSGLKVNLSNIILEADVAATNEAGYYGNSYHVDSVSNKSISMTVSSGSAVRVGVAVSNSSQGYAVKAEQEGGLKDISGLIQSRDGGFILTMPRNTTGQDQVYQITITSKENENVAVVVNITVKSEAISNVQPETPPADTNDPSTETTDPPADTNDPSTETTDPPADTNDPSTEATNPPADTSDPSTETTDPSDETEDSSTDTSEPPAESSDPSADSPETSM